MSHLRRAPVVDRRAAYRRMTAALLASALVSGAVAADVGISSSPADASTGAGGSVQVIYSSYNESSTTYRLNEQTPKTLAAVSDAQAGTPTIVLDPSVTYQTWEGFGSSLEDTTIYHLQQLTGANRTAALNNMFNPSTGNNWNMMRVPIGAADFSRTAPNYWTYADNGGNPDPTLASFSIQKDIDNGLIAVLQEARQINPQLTIMSSMWSPPAWMKTTNSIIGTGTGGCPSDGSEPRVQHGASTGSANDYYPVLAQYYVKYVQAYKAQGIPINIITLQNEPGINMNYPSTCFTPQQQAEFAIVLQGAFTAANLNTKILGLDDNEFNTFPYADGLFTNASSNPTIDGLGFHNYGGTQLWEPSSAHYAYPSKTMHLTEISNGADRLVE